MVDARTFTRESWWKTWLRTALMGAVFLLLYFVAYEVLERFWLRQFLPTEVIFNLHLFRGLSASVLLGSWAFLNIWRTRRRYDAAFAEAYRQLEAEHLARTEALARSQEFTERVFDALRDRLVVLDGEGKIIKANRVALESSPLGSLLGKRCQLMSASCSPASAGCVAQRALSEGRPVTGLVRTDPATGRIWAIDAFPVPEPETGQNAVIECARDVTEAKQLEAKLRAQEKLAALGQLSAGIAHDIGNPLASLSSELELLETEDDLPRIRESLGVLRKHIGRIGRTLREMTDFARRRGEEVDELPLEVPIQDALRMVRHEPRARRVRVETEVDPDLPRVRMVEDHLVMALVNLLINAVDAMPQGGQLTVRAMAEGEGVKLQVSDTGVGMTPEVRQRALEPLFSTKQGAGTGLGLTMTAEVMHELGGRLELESSPGSGTTVTLHFPSSALVRREKEAAHA